MLPNDILNYCIAPFLTTIDLVNFNQVLCPQDKIRRPLDVKRKLELCSAFNVIQIKRFLNLMLNCSIDSRGHHIMNFLLRPEDYMYTCTLNKNFKQVLYEKIDEFRKESRRYNHPLADDFEAFQICETLRWNPSKP